MVHGLLPGNTTFNLASLVQLLEVLLYRRLAQLPGLRAEVSLEICSRKRATVRRRSSVVSTRAVACKA